jgi:hypothetical protein
MAGERVVVHHPHPSPPPLRGRESVLGTLILTLALLVPAAGVSAQDAKPSATTEAKAAAPAKKAAPKRTVIPGPLITLEPKAIEILKASSSKLAAARSMSFTAVVSYESPSRLGAPLVYTTRSDVLLQRPDKLRVVTPGDGPASEFYYDGKIMMAYTPAENFVAVADAPPTIDATLKAAYDTAAIYFPFTDLIVADPYADIADGLRVAFYIGQSSVVGGTVTDIVAYAHDNVFVQMWIGAEDKLPRMARAVYSNDRSQLRHQMEMSNWKLDVAVPADAFGTAKSAKATRIKFSHPGEPAPSGIKPPVKRKPVKTS